MFILASSVCKSLVSNFCPKPGAKVVTYLGALVQLCYGEGGTLQTNISGMCGECSQYMDHSGFALAHCVCALPVYTAQAPGCSPRNCLRWALDFVQFLGLSHSGSGSQVLHRGADLVGPAFCPLPGPSSSSDQMLGEHTLPGVGASYHLPGLSVHLRCPMCLLWGADL